MIKSSILSLITLFSVHAGATTSMDLQVLAIANSVSQPVEATDVIDWKVGDNADYSIAGGILNGTMHTNVREAVTEGYWVQQDMDLGFMGKQKVEVLYDKSNGKVLQLIVNDKKQTPPDASDMELVESRRESVTVPKGQFECIYAKIHNKKDNNNSEIWVNPELIPVGGMIKTLAPSQMGTITVELTDFHKQ